MNTPYRVGDRIVQHCFSDSRNARSVTVQAKHRNIKNGRAGFDGVTDGGLSVWGYDEDVAYVIGAQPTEQALTTEQLMDAAIQTVRQMSPEEKAQARKGMDAAIQKMRAGRPN